jgi:hypothetical protein
MCFGAAPSAWAGEATDGTGLDALLLPAVGGVPRVLEALLSLQALRLAAVIVMNIALM